jgi:hypothetical protein
METDVTIMAIDEMDPIFDGIARRARASLGVTAWGMQVMNLPPDWDGYPNHGHGDNVDDANQEEVYIPLAGSATLVTGDQRHDLRPGMMARVGPTQMRRILPGPEGIRFVALGGVPGTFHPSAWTEIGGPWPVPPS